MFLALKEIKHEKKRYGLIVFMIFLIAYMILATWGLAYGLARENTMALESWQTKSVVLNKSANLSMSSSILTKDDLKKVDLTSKEAVVGELQAVAKKKGKTGINAQYLGVKKGEFIYKDQDLIAGRRAKSKYEVTADSRFKDKGYKLGDVMNAFRLALVGIGKGPGMFDISAFLGKEETIKRLQRAIEVLK